MIVNVKVIFSLKREGNRTRRLLESDMSDRLWICACSNNY